MAARATSESRTILLRTKFGERKVSGIPADAKITFSKVNPSADRGYDNGYCVRIYKTESNQIAVFTDVLEFFDLSLVIEQKETESVLNKDAKRGPNGEFSKTDYSETHKWVRLTY